MEIRDLVSIGYLLFFRGFGVGIILGVIVWVANQIMHIFKKSSE